MWMCGSMYISGTLRPRRSVSALEAGRGLERFGRLVAEQFEDTTGAEGTSVSEDGGRALQSRDAEIVVTGALCTLVSIEKRRDIQQFGAVLHEVEFDNLVA